MKLPKSVYNWTTILGALLASISLALIVFTFFVSAFLGLGSSYIGVFMYMVFPTVLIFGLILIPIGIYFKRKKIKREVTKDEGNWPKVDLNDVRYRNAFLIFILTTFVFIFLSAIGTYEAYHYSESVQFCGTLCHRVMEPEYVAYQNSPHARVACVECHVGPGADWFVKSKLSGLYQVYAVATKIYPRPIPTPIESLRPARETCEKCHWPEKFYSHSTVLEKHYLADDQSTEWDINLNMKVGSEHSALGLIEGIHWHINPDISIEYISPDPQRLEINWVRTTNHKTGETEIFESQDNPIPPEKLDSFEVRVMDCMDCHNRPSHMYLSPPTFIDNAITAGEIPVQLPAIKLACIEATKPVYSSKDTAMMQIDSMMRDFYKTNHPDVISGQADLLNKAIAGLQEAYSENIFPYMKVRYDVYPDHIGHKETNGCFRCHNDQHISKTGKVISKDCNICHEIKAQGTPGAMETTTIFESLEFKHPTDIEDAWKEYNCAECHAALY